MKAKVLMVCLGNICRSPLAEGILQAKVDPENVFVDSAGTGGYHIGNPPDPRSIAVAKKHGLDIENQRCRQFQKSDFKKFDVIYAMDRNNLNNILNLADSPDDAKKVKLLLTEVELPVIEVPDPYWDDNGFEKVFQLIDTACTSIAKKL
ncbi:low molecular weight protein-tyrosine-phosphatase [Zobellia sp. B3R18]|uniref:low molecular weight protein-tyrosine-phosphatase n=1 Tax=Zobellia sp. B3R18 TaxID=2841568 RepID=UPI001C0687F9|nr:low molecular weight protein-tyrosine-phosphatase [Zobellia sp. B3R18]MBU2976271.1 low molecular weight phosphotyrosine protein phosphatase [Zobellia sp. B3R18]